MNKRKPIQRILIDFMKITVAQMILAGLCSALAFSFDTNGQEILDKKISLVVKNETAKSILNRIEKKAELKFTYQPQIVKNLKNISIDSPAISIKELLNEIFDSSVYYEVVGNQIILSSVDDAGPDVVTPARVEKFVLTLTGTITDESGEVLPGVNVLERGTTNGTSTDENGKFNLNVADNNAILVFSFIGYATQEVPVGSRTVFNISLQPDATSLEEVVVVGYGTQKKSSVVAAISTVSSKEINALPVPSVEQALQGRAPGVIVTSNGAPGEAPLVRIRGINSINYASNPLYVVDGIAQVGNFNLFDSKDIESVEVLKDANSASIYGSRAAAGVILITTKKGVRDSKLHVQLDSYVGVQNAWKQLDLLNRDQYIQYGTALLTNAGAALPPRFSTMNEPIYEGSTQTFAQTETDWQDELFRSAPITQTSVSVSGGNEKSRFYVSGGYFNQEGIMKGTGFERYNLRINSDHKITRGITLGHTLFIGTGKQQREQNAGGRTQIQNMIRMVPYIPVLNPTNIGGYGGTTGADGSDPQNPVRSAVQDLDVQNNTRILGTLFLEAELTKWLKYRVNIGADFNTGRQYIYQPIYNEGFNGRSQATLNDNRDNYFSPIYTNQLTFDRTFGKHYINAIAVMEYQSATSTSLDAAGNAATNEIKELNGLSNQAVTGTRDESVIYSYIGRVNYEFANKYLLSASIRRDGASNFAPGKKFGNFPSIGIGWRISEENFLKDASAISELKLRGSYGELGYIPGNYLWQSTVSSSTNAVFGGQRSLGAYYDRLGNQALTWEVTKMTNIGIDAGFLRNKLTFSAEYFDRTTDNLILDVAPATSTGYSQPTSANIGDMRNWGFEFQAGYSENSGDLKWNLTGNIGVVKNDVRKLASATNTLDRGANGDYGNTDITRTEAGHPVQSFYGWLTDGIFQSADEVANAATQANAAPGDIRFKDVDGNGEIDAADRVYLGSFLPDFSYGLNFSANYKGLDATLFFQGVQGNEIYNGTRVLTEGMLRLFNSGTAVLDAWTPTNTDTNVPRAVNSDPNGNSRTSDRFIEDGSYFRLKNISVGYSVPEATLRTITKNTLGNLRVYIAAQNLFTITNYKGYDPEIGSRFSNQLTQGIDYGQFPQARTFLVGLQVGF